MRSQLRTFEKALLFPKFTFLPSITQAQRKVAQSEVDAEDDLGGGNTGT